VLVEGAGLTHYGWWIANFDGEWQRIPFAEDALGGQLKVGSVATDPAVIPLGTSGITIPTIPSPWNMQVFKSVDTGGGPHGNDVTGKHIDVFTGDGKAAEQETFRITGRNHTVCISNVSPTSPPDSSPPPPPPPGPAPTPSPPPTPTPIIPADIPPVADAGHSRPGQIVNQGSLVTLDGSASRDPNGDPLTYAWTQVSGPTVQLSNPNEAKVGFTAPSNLDNDAESSFKLTVTDMGGLSDSDTVSILVRNTTAPTAPSTGTTFDFGAAGDFGDGSTATNTAQSMVNHYINLFVGEGDCCYCSSDGRWWTDTMKPLSSSGIIAKGSDTARDSFGISK
jgi:3D (Asp-Asp-Asp) domain-containing protein